MGLNDIEPTGEGSSMTPATLAPQADGVYDNSPNPEYCSAGSVGASPQKPNPYRQAGGSGADAALDARSNVQTLGIDPQPDTFNPPDILATSGDKAVSSSAAVGKMTMGQRTAQAAQAVPKKRPQQTHGGVPIRHPSAAGTFGHVPVKPNPNRRKK